MSSDRVAEIGTSAGASERVRSIFRRTGSVLWDAAPALAFTALILGVLEAATRAGRIDPLILPPPSEIARTFWDLTTAGVMWLHASKTLQAMTLGYIAGVTPAAALAIIVAWYPWLRRMVYPLMVVLQITPRIAIAPVLITALGFGSSPRIILIASVCFFPVFVNMLTALENVDGNSVELFRSLGASKRTTLWRLFIPSALPVTFAGLKTGATFAMLAAVVVEFLTAERGLGVLVLTYSRRLDMAAGWAVITALTVIGLLVYGVMEFLDRTIVYWNHATRLDARSRRVGRRHAAKDAKLLAGMRPEIATGHTA